MYGGKREITCMSGKQQIRKMCADDIASVTAIESGCFERPWNDTMIGKELANADSLCLVIQDENVSAFLIAHRIADEMELMRIAVVPEKRRHGYGRMLLGALIQTHREQRIILEVDESNSAAIRLYESFDFIVSGKRPRYYGDKAALLMDRPARPFIEAITNENTGG